MKKNKPLVQLGNLNGPEGNAFVVLGRARKVAMENNIDWNPIDTEAQSGDYEHLLETLEEHFELEYTR